MAQYSPNTTLIYGDAATGAFTCSSLTDGVTATTQAPADNSTKLATTAYVDAAVLVENLWNRAGTTLSTANAGDDISLANGISFTAGVAVTAGSYQVIRDADGTNQLHFNVPTGASYEFSVNDVAVATISTAGLITATFSGSLTGNVTGDCSGSSGTCTGNAGSATYASAITVTDDTTTNATMYPLWATANTGNLPNYVTSTKLYFNPSTGILTATGFSGPLTGDVTGNVSGSSGSCTGQAATVSTITGLAPDTATTQAAQPNVTSLGTLTALNVAGDITDYEPTNNANPEFRLGSADAEEVHFQAVYDAGAQTLDYVQFTTDAASAIADKGKYAFNVDGTDVAYIADDGFIAASGKGLCAGKIGGNTLLLQAYDTDTGPAYVTFATLTSGATPTMALSGDVTGVTQSAADNSTKLATTAYADVAGATKSHVHNTYYSVPFCASAVLGAGLTRYIHPGYGSADISTECYFVANEACTISSMYVIAGTAPGGADTHDFYIYKNGAQETMTVQLSAAATTGNTSANPVSLAAGDYFLIQAIGSATSGCANASITVKITSASAAPTA